MSCGFHGLAPGANPIQGGLDRFAEAQFCSTTGGGNSNVGSMKVQVVSRKVPSNRLWKASLQRIAVAAVFFTTVVSLLAVADTSPSASAYAKWIKPWAARPTTSAALNGAELKLIVTTVRGEAAPDAVAAMTPKERLYLSFHIMVSATEVATNGDSLSYFTSNTQSSRAPVKPLSADDLQKLDQAVAQLPDDGGQLPPAGQRVIVQVLENGQWHVHVYDGAAAPAPVKSILTLLANPYEPGH